MATSSHNANRHEISRPMDTSDPEILATNSTHRSRSLAIDSGSSSYLHNGHDVHPGGDHAQPLQHSDVRLDPSTIATQTAISTDSAPHTQDAQQDRSISIDRVSQQREFGDARPAESEAIVHPSSDHRMVFAHLVQAASSWLKANTHRLRGEVIWRAARRNNLPRQDAQVLAAMRRELDDLFSSLKQRRAILQAEIASYTRATRLS